MFHNFFVLPEGSVLCVCKPIEKMQKSPNLCHLTITPILDW